MANSDGSVVLSTKIDTSGAESGLSRLKNKIAALRNSDVAIKQLTAAIKGQEFVIAKLSKHYAELVASGKGGSELAQRLKTEIDALTRELAEMETAAKSLGKTGLQKFAKGYVSAANSISSALNGVVARLAAIFSLTKLIQISATGSKLATQAEASAMRIKSIYGEASDVVGDFIDENARALLMSKNAAAQYASVYGNLFSSWAEETTNAQLTTRYLEMTAVVASQTGRTVEDVQERIRSGLLGNTEAIEDLGIFVNVSTIEMTDAFQRMAGGKSWEQLDEYTKQQIRTMAILEQATNKYGDTVLNTSQSAKSNFAAAWEEFQATWGVFVNEILQPILERLTRVLDIATKGLNNILGRSDKFLNDAKDAEAATDETADNINRQTDAQNELNDALKKTVASFDDINILSGGSASDTDEDKEKEKLKLIPKPEGGSGDNLFEETDAQITALMEKVGKALMVLGCVLLVAGNVGLGLGLIVAGAAVEGIAEAADDGGAGLEGIIKKISTAVAIAGAVAIVLGILLCTAQMYGAGIKLISIGALALFGTVALNWNAIKEVLTDKWFASGIALAGAALVILGILLCFVTLPLGISLIAVGAVAIVSVVALNWNAITSRVKNFFEENSALIAGAGVGLIVLGILLCFVPTLIPFGIGLIALGAGALTGGVAVSWSAITDWVKKAWESVGGFWNEYIAPVFTAEFWKQLAIDCGNGLIAGFEGAVNAVIGMFETMINWIVGGLNKISFDIPSWVPEIGGKTFGFDIPEAEFGRLDIPRLAKGAVIPANREFLAVLGDQRSGTNIEAPAALIKQMVFEALGERGYNGSGDTTVVLEVDGREFGRAVIEQGRRESRRIGTKWRGE